MSARRWDLSAFLVALVVVAAYLTFILGAAYILGSLVLGWLS